jgi:hypothetical protein
MVLARSSIRGRPVLRCWGMSLVAETVDGVAPARASGGMSRLILRAAPWERRQASVRTSARVHELVPSHRPSEPVGKNATSMAVAVDHLIRSATTTLRRLVIAIALVLALRHVNFAATRCVIRMRCMRQSKIQRSDKRSANRLVRKRCFDPIFKFPCARAIIRGVIWRSACAYARA